MDKSKSKVKLSPQVDDGKCYKWTYKFMGKLLERNVIGRPYDQYLEYTFEKGKITDDQLDGLIEYPCKGKPATPVGKKSVNEPAYAAKATAPKPSPQNGNAKVGDGKCYQHKGVYLGKLTKLGISGREQMIAYEFEKKTLYSDNLSNSNKIEAVECKANATGGKRKTKKNRNRRNRQTRRS